MTYARWAKTNEIMKSLTKINIKGGIEKSGIPIFYDKNDIYIDDSLTHNLVIGSTGSGKTQTIILPLIKFSTMAKESFIVMDQLGDLYNETKEELEKLNYNIIKIDFKNKNTNTWNPLTYPLELIKKGNETDGYDILTNIGYYLFFDTKNKESDPFWINSANDYLTGLILYLYNKNQNTNITLTDVYKLSNQINTEENRKKILDEIKDNINIYSNLVTILKAPFETRESIITVFNQLIKQYLVDENLCELLNNTNFDLKNISRKPTAVFIINNQNNRSNKLTSCFIDQIINTVINEDTNKRVNLILDDFDSMVPLSNFGKIINSCRRYNIRITSFIKGYSILNNLYTKEQLDILKLCFGNVIYLLSNDLDTLEEISKYCGNEQNGNKITPLISIEELKILNMFETVILKQRMMPIKTTLTPFYKWK